MEQLIITAKITLANTFVMYYKAHKSHWNVVGENFSQYHDFFGDLYEELHNAVDVIAEQIRALDAFAPESLDDMYMYKTIPSTVPLQPGDAQAYFANLLIANTYVIESLNKLFNEATAQQNQGLANFAADRLDKHAKHGWMIKSHLKAGE